MEEDWKQDRIKHCPYKDCKGMLLQNDYRYEELCCDCKTLWMDMSNESIIVEENYEVK